MKFCVSCFHTNRFSRDFNLAIVLKQRKLSPAEVSTNKVEKLKASHKRIYKCSVWFLSATSAFCQDEN